MSHQDLDRKLWDFMLAIYAKPKVQPACLELQQICQADIVTLLIWAYFIRPDQTPLSAQQVSHLQAHIAPWRQRAILPLRHLRIDLRDGSDLPSPEREVLREKIKALELSAERAQVIISARWLQDNPSPLVEAPEGGLRLILGPNVPPEALETIRQAALSL